MTHLPVLVLKKRCMVLATSEIVATMVVAIEIAPIVMMVAGVVATETVEATEVGLAQVVDTQVVAQRYHL